MAIWAATIPLMPYALLRRKWNLLPALVIIFFMLLIDIFIGLNRPNPDHVMLISVVQR